MTAFLAPELINGRAYLAPAEPPAVTTPVEPATNSIIYTLSTWDGVPRPNLSGLEWALFKQLKASLFGAPAAKGTLESTNGAAELKIDVPANTVPVGQYFLVLTNDKGDTTLASIVSVV